MSGHDSASPFAKTTPSYSPEFTLTVLRNKHEFTRLREFCLDVEECCTGLCPVSESYRVKCSSSVCQWQSMTHNAIWLGKEERQKNPFQSKRSGTMNVFCVTRFYCMPRHVFQRPVWTHIISGVVFKGWASDVTKLKLLNFPVVGSMCLLFPSLWGHCVGEQKHGSVRLAASFCKVW